MPPFNFLPATTFWQPENARWMAEAANLAYQDPKDIEASAKTWGFKRFHFLDRRNTQGYVIAGDDLILIAFRGTEITNLQDVMTDAKIELVKFPGRRGKVHAGFWGALNLVWKDLLTILEEEQTTAQPIFITGHSLGGALATLATARFRLEMDKPVNGLYTFGAPRSGDREFAAAFNGDYKPRAFRYVNNNDVITRVPAREMGYSHVGTFLYFDAKGELHNDLALWNRFVETVKGGIKDFLKPGPDFVNDHSMEKYLANCRKRTNLSKRLVMADTLVDD
jgi:triacylglycerol lipase